MRKSPSPVPKSPRPIQTNAPEYTQRMLQEQNRRTPDEAVIGSYVTPPSVNSGRGGGDVYPFQTPRPSTSKAVRKEKLSGGDFRQVPAPQPNSGFRTTRGSIQSIPESGPMSFTDVPRAQGHYDHHHQSMTQLHSASMGHYNQPGLSSKQWHSCADINADQGHFSEPLSEFTLNQSGFRDDIFLHSPKRDRHYGHIHEQYGRDFVPVPQHGYHDVYASYGNVSSGSYTSLATQSLRGRPTSPACSPPRIRSPGKSSGSKSPVQKLLPVKSLFDPLKFKDPRLDTSHGSDHFDSSNYSIGSSNRDSIQSHDRDPPITGDLAQWQQRHQMQLKKQHLDTSQNAYDAQDPYKWDALKRAADGIIKEKDMIIERMKIKMQDMEVRVRENEEHVKLALSLGNRGNTEMLSMKLQEFQFENDTTRGQLQATLKLKDDLIEQLQQKLGGVEYENQQMKEELKDKKDFSKEEVENLRKQVSNKENLVLEWKERHQELVDNFMANQEKLKGLERYVSDLPTRDDYSSKSQEISFFLPY
ncbi:uncharacterized protein LOC135488622 [Lineus longissimus]|uniref:uncharacterized protein LOC135488622 n=1 Tax=Lineus longissimus TaxID=88925 RepID=UPI002B4D7203